MPRIAAASIAEHVRQQEAAILAAAARLFAEHGVVGTDLGDIAAAVGLARSSLYRYFPDKDHIVLRWFENELGPVVAESEAIVRGPGSPRARLERWLDFQLDYGTHPDHQLAHIVSRDLSMLAPEVQAAIGAGHTRLYGTLSEVVTEALAARRSGEGRDPVLVTRLIAALLEAAAGAVAGGADAAVVRAELCRSAKALLRG